MSKIVCSTTHLYHYLFNPAEEVVVGIYRDGLRPLSDFPESERWQELEAQMPGFYKNLYEMIAADVLKKPYSNSGVFISSIDFHQLPGTYLFDKPRFAIPIVRIQPDDAVITYVIDEERQTYPFSEEVLQQVAEYWVEEQVREWFGKDNTKVFFYVPQVAVYQGSIPVSPDDLEQAPGA